MLAARLRRRWFSALAFLALIPLPGAAPASPAPGTAAEIWIASAEAGDPPLLLTPETISHPLPWDAVLWDGRGTLWRQAKGTVPARPIHGRTVRIRIVDTGGKGVPFASLQGRPLHGPFLPEPLGRWPADGEGKVTLFLPEGERWECWVDGCNVVPIPVVVDGTEGALEVLAVPEERAVLCVQDAFGRTLAHPRLIALPRASFANPFQQMGEVKTLRQEVRGDGWGRLRLSQGALLSGLVHVPGFIALARAGGPPFESSAVRLEKSPVIRVEIVQKEDSRPLAAGTWKSEAALPDLPWLVLREEGSFSQGIFRFAPPLYPCRLTLLAPERVPQHMILSERPSQGISVELERGVVLEGRVVDEEGNPVKGAEVCLPGDACAESRDDGRFTLPPAFPQSAYTLSVSADGYLLRELGLSEKEIRSKPIVLIRGASLFGSVLDEQTGQAVPHATVRLRALSRVRSHSYSFEVPVSEDGSFRFEGLETVSFELSAWAPGYEAKTEKVSPADIGGSEVSLLLKRGKAIRGRVLMTTDGEGIPGVSVALHRLLSCRDFPAKEGQSDFETETTGSGVYFFTGVKPGKYRLEAAGAEGTAVLDDLTVTEETTDFPDLVLKHSATLRGILVKRTATQDGLSGFRVSLMTQAFDLAPRTTLTDGEGRFTFDDVPAGRYRLAAYRPLSAEPAVTADVDLLPGEEREILLTLDGARATFAVEVAGRPAAGGHLAIAPRTSTAFDSGLLYLTTPFGRVILGLPSALVTGDVAPDGTATLEGLAPGPSLATLYWNGMRYTAPVSVPEVPLSPVPLSFPGHTVEGTVVLPDGSPAVGATVSFSYEGVGVLPGTGTRSDENGRFRLQGLGGGQLVLRAIDRLGEAVAEVPLTLPADSSEIYPVNLHLARTSSSPHHDSP